MTQPTIRSHGPRAVPTVQAALCAWALSALDWLRAEHVNGDRGSDSSEKAFMIILAIALGGAVTVAAVAFVAGKTALFK
jgi:hypothetical protein